MEPTVVEYHTVEDNFGRIQFTMIWMINGEKRAQVYRCRPSDRGFPSAEEVRKHKRLKVKDTEFVWKP